MNKLITLILPFKRLSISSPEASFLGSTVFQTGSPLSVTSHDTLTLALADFFELPNSEPRDFPTLVGDVNTESDETPPPSVASLARFAAAPALALCVPFFAAAFALSFFFLQDFCSKADSACTKPFDFAWFIILVL